MDSIRDALTAAVDKAEKDAPADKTITNDAAIGGDERVDSAPVGRDESVSTGADAQDTGDAPAADSAEAAAPSTPTVPETQAPASWSPEERAGWATVPPAARKAIERREGEMNRALQVSATARRRVEALDKMAHVYQPLLDHYGVTVEAAMPALLATRAVLEVGTMEQKATMLANICADFGIDIQKLDDALTERFAGGVPAPRNQPVQAPNFRNDPNLAPLYAMADQVSAARREKAEAAIATVKANPHYETVRFTMADLIDQAKAGGRDLSLDSALRVALELHGLAQPAPAAGMTASDAGRALAAARNAASSVSGAPRPSPARKPGEGSVHDEVAALMSGRR